MEARHCSNVLTVKILLCRMLTSQPTIHVGAVVCGERTIEATTMLKSTTLFTNRTVQFHVVAEDQLHDNLKSIFNDWKTVQSGQVMFKLYSLHFPSGENADEWKRLFKPCAAQRLFLLVSTYYFCQFSDKNESIESIVLRLKNVINLSIHLIPKWQKINILLSPC